MRNISWAGKSEKVQWGSAKNKNKPIKRFKASVTPTPQPHPEHHSPPPLPINPLNSIFTQASSIPPKPPQPLCLSQQTTISHHFISFSEPQSTCKHLLYHQFYSLSSPFHIKKNDFTFSFLLFQFFSMN